MKKPKAKTVELPQEINVIAQNLSIVVAKSVDENLKIMLNNKDEEPIKSINSWIDLAGSILPVDVNKWSSKDFVHYFTQNLQKECNVAYVVEYSRDCSAIKKIKDQLFEIGITDQQILKDFIMWAIKNYDKLRDEYSRFDIPSLSKSINEFLQYNDVIKGEKRSLGFDILNKMENEIVQNSKTGMVNLLKQFGIPLTAQFYFSKDFGLDQIKNGIYSRLKRFGEKDIMLLQNSMQHSIDFSPYPDWFCFLDWREQFKNLIEQYNLSDLKWWRNIDYSGNFADEYNMFKGDV